jgi:PAS domain S-box-containing protein
MGLVENSSENIYTHDLLGNSTVFSKAFEQLIGYSHEEVCKTSFSRILSPECVEFVWRHTLCMLADRKPSSCEAVIVTKDGLKIPVGVNMHLVYKKGKPIEVQGIVRDLSSPISPRSALTESDHLSRVFLTL